MIGNYLRRLSVNSHWHGFVDPRCGFTLRYDIRSTISGDYEYNCHEDMGIERKKLLIAPSPSSYVTVLVPKWALTFNRWMTRSLLFQGPSKLADRNSEWQLALIIASSFCLPPHGQHNRRLTLYRKSILTYGIQE
jgi:hypothetical protein